jgi:single-strand DNA-binding protein
MTPAQAPGAIPSHRNEVVVLGRLSTPALSRQLPSGDELMTWRVVVDRPAGSRKRTDGRGQDFDVVDCTTWSRRVRTAALRWEPGDLIEVRGSLRRRFWRAAGGAPQSRCELEARGATRVATAGGQLTRRRRTG